MVQEEWRLIAIAFALAACGSPAPANPPTPASKLAPSLDLPSAAHAQELSSAPDVPRLEVSRGHVVLDGKIITDTDPVDASGKPQRLDGVFEPLKTLREAWKVAHPGRSYPGLIRLAIDRSTTLLVVKSVFFTAAFAGHPNASFVVRRPDGSEGLLAVDAQLPAPPGTERASPPTLSPTLLVGASGDQRRLVFQKNGAITFTIDTTAKEAAGRMAKQWPLSALHRDAADSSFDQATLFVNDIRYADLVDLVDSMTTITRDLAVGGKTEKVPAINVTLAVSTTMPTEPDGAPKPLVNGRVPPEIIQRVVRSHFGEIKKCYAAGLAKDPNLEGKVIVKFVIDTTGHVPTAADDASTLPDKSVVACVVAAFGKMVFPAPAGGVVHIVYPISFSPTD